MTFAAPSNSTENVKVADLANHLLIISPVEYKTGIPTVHGDAEAIEVNVIDLDTNQEHSSLLWFNVALRNALKTKTGQQLRPYRDWETDRKSTRLNSSHSAKSRMPSSA